MYSEGISTLKKYELHQAFKKSGKNYLMDIYYEESQMNKWRDSCLRGQENLKVKFDKYEKECPQARAVLQEKKLSTNMNSEMVKNRDFYQTVEQIVAEKEPLIISLISTVYEDLQTIHTHLNAFCSPDPNPEKIKAAQNFFLNIDGLKNKLKMHDEYLTQTEEYSKEIEILIADLTNLILKNMTSIVSLHKEVQAIKKDTKNFISMERIKNFQECVARVQKDFNYLKNPALLPKAYEQSLLEIKRRRRYRKNLDEDIQRLTQAIKDEDNLRQQFMNEYGKVLPSEFIPQFRDKIMSLKLEGASKEYELPEIEDFDDEGNDRVLASGAGSKNSPGV